MTDYNFYIKNIIKIYIERHLNNTIIPVSIISSWLEAIPKKQIKYKYLGTICRTCISIPSLAISTLSAVGLVCCPSGESKEMTFKIKFTLFDAI